MEILQKKTKEYTGAIRTGWGLSRKMIEQQEKQMAGTAAAFAAHNAGVRHCRDAGKAYRFPV